MRKIAIILIIVLWVVFDLASKAFVEQYLFGSWKEICINPESNSFASSLYCENNIIELHPFLALELSYNRGIAFSLPIEGVFLQILTLGVILSLLLYYRREEYQKNSPLLDVGYALIFAGALSHAYERIFIGHVVDFIAVKYFAILNFADIFISIWAFLIILSYVLHRR